MLSKKLIVPYFENHIKTINKFLGQNAKLLNVKGSGAYSYHVTTLFKSGKNYSWQEGFGCNTHHTIFVSDICYYVYIYIYI